MTFAMGCLFVERLLKEDPAVLPSPWAYTHSHNPNQVSYENMSNHREPQRVITQQKVNLKHANQLLALEPVQSNWYSDMCTQLMPKFPCETWNNTIISLDADVKVLCANKERAGWY